MTSLRRLKYISKNVSFFAMSVRRLKNISKRCLLCDIFKTSRAYLKKDVFSVTCLRRLKNISCKYLWFIKNIRRYDFRRVIIISNKIDLGPLETLTKWIVFWEQCIDISQVCREYQLADICVRVLASQRSSKPSCRCIIYYF